MLVYLVNIALIIIFGMALLAGNCSDRNKKIYCIIVTIQWILMIGLRHFTVGGIDVYLSYYISFNKAIHMPWSEIWNGFAHVFSFCGIEPGYLLFEKIVSLFTNDYQLFLFCVGLVIMIPLGVFIYRNSSDPVLSFILYSCHFYSFFSIGAFRQSIATSLVVWMGYEFVKKRKLWPFLFLTFLAFTFHRSSIVFLPFYFIGNMKLTKFNFGILSAGGVLTVGLGSMLYAPIADWLGYGNIASSNRVNLVLTFMALMITFFIVAVWRMNKMITNNADARFSLNALILAVFFTLLTVQNHAFMRIQSYFSIFMLLLYPDIVASFDDKKEHRMVLIFSVEILLLLFIHNHPQYLFFWQ